MIFDYQLDFEEDFLLGSGENARKKASRDVGNSLCHNFTIRENIGETDTPKVLPGKVSDSFLFGPACDIKTRSVIYPCNRSRCRIPCICIQCRKRVTKMCSKTDCSCSDCSQLFKEHSRYHRVGHQNCRFCENILQCFPNFNFWFLNSGKRRLQVEGHHRNEHFPIKPLVQHDDLQVYSSNPNCCTNYSSSSGYEDYIKNMTMQASYFLISCHECDHHFKSSQQFREHVNLNHLVPKRFYHNFLDTLQEETDFKCEHCPKTFKNKSELVKHITRNHFQYHPMFDCDQCHNKYSRLSELSRHKRCVHKPLPRNQCNYCGKDFLRKDHLSAHVFGVHENGQIYNCEKCNTKFNKKSNFDRHQSSSKTGNGSSNYQCNDCEISFCTGKQMHAHLNDHIGLSCEYCGEKFKRNFVLQRHVRNRKVLKCTYCDQDYCNEPSLRKHTYQLHLDEMLLPPE
jgi:hypothetical protein